jgi:hypothetical protein
MRWITNQANIIQASGMLMLQPRKRPVIRGFG